MRVGMYIVALLNSMQTAMLITAFRIIVPPCRALQIQFTHPCPSDCSERDSRVQPGKAIVQNYAKKMAFVFDRH